MTLLTAGDGSDPSTLGYDEWHGTSLVTASEQSTKLCDGNETVLKEPTEGAKFVHWSGRCAYGRYRNSVFDHKRGRCVGRRALEVAAKHPTRTMVPLVSKYSETRKSPKRFKPRNGNDGGKDSFISDLTRLIFWRSDKERRQSVNQQQRHSLLMSVLVDVVPVTFSAI